jgi:hypothetical protein
VPCSPLSVRLYQDLHLYTAVSFETIANNFAVLDLIIRTVYTIDHGDVWRLVESFKRNQSHAPNPAS